MERHRESPPRFQIKMESSGYKKEIGIGQYTPNFGTCRGGMRCVLFLAVVIVQINSIIMCPTGCHCSSFFTNGLSVDCSEGERFALPMDIPCLTIRFNLNSNLLRKVHFGAFPCQFHMTKLSLRSNAITTVEESSFDNLTSLIQLSLRGNRLTSIPHVQYCKDLRIVDLSFNLFTAWPVLFSARTTNSTFLTFRFPWNPLKVKGHFVVPYAVRNIDISGLPVSVISSNSFSQPGKVNGLEMSHSTLNRIHSLSQLSEARFIALSYNRIRFVEPNAFENLLHLKILDLENNKIRVIPLISNMPSLEKVSLDYNEITRTFEGALSNLPRLKSLGLKGNRILSLYVIPPLPNLRSLILNGNSLHSVLTLEQLALYWRSVTNINVAENDLTGLNIRECSKLKYLIATGNSIEFVNFLDPLMCTNLIFMFLDSNLITGLQSFNNLRRLEIISLPSNRISVFNATVLVNVTTLRSLNLRNNLIRELKKLPVLPELQELDLSYNHIQWIGNTTLLFPALKKIDFTGNKLYSMPSMSGMPSLEFLNLNKNQLSDISSDDIGEIPVLQTLFIAENKLTRFPAPLRNQIKFLNIANNNISVCDRIVFDRFHSLTNLIIGENQLQGSPLFPSSLKRLTMNNNGVERISISLQHLPHEIEYLSLRSNRISFIGHETFFGHSLLYLDISSNNLSFLSPFLFQFADQLSTILVEYNSLSSVDDLTLFGLSGLNFLYLQWNKIVILTEKCFSPCPRLTQLDLTGNPLQRISDGAFYGLLSTEYLTFSDINVVDTFSPSFSSDLISLMYLRMDNNSLVDTWCLNSSLVIRGSISWVTFRRNGLTRNFPQMETRLLHSLDLSHNYFTQIPEQLTEEMRHPYLQRLFLSWNKIRVLESNAFRNLEKLFYISLANNEIVTIQSRAFPMSHVANYIDISNNNLTSIQRSDLPLAHNGLLLDPSGNPWRCDCDLQSFQTIFSLFESPALCATPSELSNQSLTDVVLSDGNCRSGENFLCSPMNPFLFATVGDRNLNLPCPLNVTRRDEITWTLPENVTLQINSSLQPVQPISVSRNGLLTFLLVTNEMSGKYKCMAPNLGILTEFSLTLVVIEGRSKTELSAEVHNNSFWASQWSSTLECGGYSYPRDKQKLSIPMLVLITAPSVCLVTISTSLILYSYKRKNAGTVE